MQIKLNDNEKELCKTHPSFILPITCFICFILLNMIIGIVIGIIYSKDVDKNIVNVEPDKNVTQNQKINKVNGKSNDNNINKVTQNQKTNKVNQKSNNNKNKVASSHTTSNNKPVNKANQNIKVLKDGTKVKSFGDGTIYKILDDVTKYSKISEKSLIKMLGNPTERYEYKDHNEKDLHYDLPLGHYNFYLKNDKVIRLTIYSNKWWHKKGESFKFHKKGEYFKYNDNKEFANMFGIKHGNNITTKKDNGYVYTFNPDNTSVDEICVQEIKGETFDVITFRYDKKTLDMIQKEIFNDN